MNQMSEAAEKRFREGEKNREKIEEMYKKYGKTFRRPTQPEEERYLFVVLAVVIIVFNCPKLSRYPSPVVGYGAPFGVGPLICLGGEVTQRSGFLEDHELREVRVWKF